MRILVALVLVLLLGGCGVAHGSAGPAPSPVAPTSATAPGDQPGAQPDRSRTPACAEVRAGIDAFNLGDFTGTVAHFRAALPLARGQARHDSSRAAADLLAAVRYYADLAPSAYLRSSESSPAFATYKAITLGQCEPADQPSPGAPSSSAPPGVTT